MSGWWAGLYDDRVAELFLCSRSPAEIDEIVGFLRRELAIEPGQRVLDQCAGIGVLSAPIARAGALVVAVDQSAGFIARARAALADLPVELAVGDACAFRPSAPVDAAFNWATSFGYFPTDAENAEMLRAAWSALRPGGRFALDTMNVPGVLRAFQPEDSRILLEAGKTVTLVRKSAIDLATGRLEKRWIFEDETGVSERRSSVRLYLPDALGAMFRAVGFTELRFFGSPAGEPLGLDSPRCIVIGERVR